MKLLQKFEYLKEKIKNAQSKSNALRKNKELQDYLLWLNLDNFNFQEIEKSLMFFHI